MPSIRIIFTPPGEAPLEVREAWVGLILPLSKASPGLTTKRTWGAITGPVKGFDRLKALVLGRYDKTNGYAVDILTAIDILEPPIRKRRYGGR